MTMPPAEVPITARPKRSFGVGALALVALLSGLLAASGSLAIGRTLRSSAAAAGAESALYQCPMHPAIVREHPGNCPICGMKLVKIEKAPASPDAKSAEARRVLFYRSPMDPKVTSKVPAKDGMGMDFVPVYEDESAAVPASAGLAVVEIDPARQQLIGLQTSEVRQGPVGGNLRTVGRVAVDETRVRHINLKVSGFVEHVYVDFVGKRVKRGDPLFSLYSPELLAAQGEYLVALNTKNALAIGGPLNHDGDALVSSARQKLALWDVPEADLQRLAKTGQLVKSLTLYSPLAGVVTRKDVVEGMKLDAGAMPYEIVDLSSIWVLADVYESELGFVAENMPAALKLTAFPNREFKGKAAFIDPLLDPETRTVKVRLTFTNATGELRPGMFGEVVLFGAPREGLSVPPDAIIDSGTEKVVFVALGSGKFQPRTVKLGASDDARVEVVSGLSLGERVVTRANFLVDSESRLRASLAESGAEKAPESARVLPEAVAPAPAMP